MLIPRHVAIIMDGNGRWAKERGLPAVEGHRRGVDAIKRAVDAAVDIGIEYLSLYAFSVDNWKRPKQEVDSLMDLLRRFLKKEKKDIHGRDIRLLVIGRIEELPGDINKSIREFMEMTKGNGGLKLVIALNYGARAEIVDGVKRLAADALCGRISVDSINEDLFSGYLYTAGIPDPDLFIRTSGEMRLSNFMLWQLSYTELWITPVYWPDFGREHMDAAVEEFNSRQRRFGGR